MTTSKKKKIISLATVFCSAIVVIFGALQLSGIWDKALFVAEPMMGVVLILHAVQNRYKNKTLSILLLCTAVVLFIITGFLIFFQFK